MAVLGETKPAVGFNDVGVLQEHGAYFVLRNVTTAYYGQTTHFQQRLDQHGASETTSGRTADQYYTVVNVTSGRGVVGWILTSSGANTASTFTVKCTIDGLAVERTVDPQQGTTYQRVLFGNTGLVNAAGSYQEMTHVLYGNGRTYWESGHDTTTYPAVYYGASYIYLLPAHEMLKLNIPCMQFKKSLKVEIKESHTGSSDQWYRNHYVNYYLTG